MRLGTIALPLASLIIAVILLKVFPITAEKVHEMRKILEERRGVV